MPTLRSGRLVSVLVAASLYVVIPVAAYALDPSLSLSRCLHD